jgi:hypothetical protein
MQCAGAVLRFDRDREVDTIKRRPEMSERTARDAAGLPSGAPHTR